MKSRYLAICGVGFSVFDSNSQQGYQRDIEIFDLVSRVENVLTRRSAHTFRDALHSNFSQPLKNIGLHTPIPEDAHLATVGIWRRLQSHLHLRR